MNEWIIEILSTSDYIYPPVWKPVGEPWFQGKMMDAYKMAPNQLEKCIDRIVAARRNRLSATFTYRIRNVNTEEIIPEEILV